MLTCLLVFRRVWGGHVHKRKRKRERQYLVKLGKELRKQRANKKSLAVFRSCI